MDTVTPQTPSLGVPADPGRKASLPVLCSPAEESGSRGGGLLLTPHPCVGVLEPGCHPAPGLCRGARVLVLPRARWLPEVHHHRRQRGLRGHTHAPQSRAPVCRVSMRTLRSRQAGLHQRGSHLGLRVPGLPGKITGFRPFRALKTRFPQPRGCSSQKQVEKKFIPSPAPERTAPPTPHGGVLKAEGGRPEKGVFPAWPLERPRPGQS